MNVRQFTEMRTIEDLNMSGLRIGDKFLFGTKMVNQKETKELGEMITYYEVIGINQHGHVEYKPVYKTLREY